MSITFYTTENQEGINLSNSNAREVISMLGIEFDYCGSISSAELAVRCETGISLIDAMPSLDPGKETIETVCAGGARWIDCGRDAGYLRMRFSQLLDLARTAPEIHWALGSQVSLECELDARHAEVTLK